MIRGTTIPEPNRQENLRSVGVSIHNRFDLEVVDANSGELKQKAVAENTICNALWTRLCSSNTWNTYIHYGAGSGTPSPADASLFNFLGYLSSSVYSHGYDYENNTYKVTTKAVLSETEAVGKTLTEIGIAYGTSSSNLVTHAMLRDMNGNPVSLEKTDVDIINIYATVFCHFSSPEFTRVLGTVISSSGGLHSGILGHLVGLSSMSVTCIYPSRGYAPWNLKSFTNAAVSYNPAQRQIRIDAPRASATAWNYGGIKTLFLCFNAIPEVSFEIEEGDGWYNKTTILDEAVGTGDGTTKEFSTDIAFAKNLVAKVNGVEVPSEVEYTTPYRELLSYFRVLKSPRVGASNLPPFYWDESNSAYKSSRTNFEGASILENTLWETVGIKTLNSNYYSTLTAYASNDLEHWEYMAVTSPQGLSVPEDLQNCRYWKFVNTSTSSPDTTLVMTPNRELPVKNKITFLEAPPAGSVITASYDAICIGKDTNHVFDFSVTFQFNEYTEAQ